MRGLYLNVTAEKGHEGAGDAVDNSSLPLERDVSLHTFLGFSTGKEEREPEVKAALVAVEDGLFV